MPRKRRREKTCGTRLPGRLIRTPVGHFGDTRKIKPTDRHTGHKERRPFKPKVGNSKPAASLRPAASRAQPKDAVGEPAPQASAHRARGGGAVFRGRAP